MTWAAYIRVSTIDQHPENQRIELEQWLKRRGISEVEWFEEKESTRRTRPIKQDLIQRAYRGEFDGIVVWQLSRWARSLQELIPELDYFSKNNIVFVSVRGLGEVDTTTATGRLMVNMIGSFAEFERDLISERTKAGLQRRRAEGKTLGRPKGSRDKKRRRKSGYHLRWAGNKKGE